MEYIILDLEWNQCPSGKAREQVGLPFEIIEIGAIKTNENWEIIDRFERMICPQVYKKLHSLIQGIVNITDEELKQGEKFPQVCEEFLRWCGEDFRFCTWGLLDLTELQRNMEFYQIEGPFEKPFLFYDIQKLFSYSFLDGKQRVTLEHAVDYLGIEKDIPFHRAIDDAIYTAKVAARLDMEKAGGYVSVDYYHTPRNKKEEIHIFYDTYTKYISREFPDREKAMHDKEVTSTRCYKCNRTARKKIRWFSGNSKTYYCLAYCPEHGFMKGKIKLKKVESGSVVAIKVLKLIEPEEAALIKEKQELIRRRRRLQRQKNILK